MRYERPMLGMLQYQVKGQETRQCAREEKEIRRKTGKEKKHGQVVQCAHAISNERREETKYM